MYCGTRVKCSFQVHHSTHLCVVELHGVVSGQRHTQAFVQEFSEGILGVFQEEAVVAERRHGNWHLGQVVEVLQNRALKKDAFCCST